MGTERVLTKLHQHLDKCLTAPDLQDMLRRVGAHEVLIQIDDGPGEFAVRFGGDGDREISETPADEASRLVARGTSAAWEDLLLGKRPWSASTNAALGSIRLAGDAAAWAWLTPMMSRVFATEPRVIQPVYEHLGSHVDTTGITGRYTSVDGVDAYFESTAGTEGAPAVLLLHTAGRDGRQWHGVMARLGRGMRLYAPDLPGHGKSWPQRPKPVLDDIEQIAQWLLKFMTAIGEEEFIVAGTSVGGNLALLLPALSDRVVGAVAFQGADLTPTISETALALMDHPRVAVQHSSMDQALDLVGERAVPEAHEMIHWSIRTLSPPPQRGDLTAYSRTDTRDLMAGIRCPVTLVHGDRDWLATREMVDAAASRIRDAEVQVVTLPGIGHYPHLEDPAAAAALIEQLAERVSARAR